MSCWGWPRKVLLRRGSKNILESKNFLLLKNEIIVEIPDELKSKNFKDLVGKKCKYKIGDGIHRYNELPYEKELISVAFYVNKE